MREIKIKEEFIKLGQLLKLAGVVENGGEAKEVIQNGQVTYNGLTETRRGKKCVPGDIIEYRGEQIKVI